MSSRFFNSLTKSDVISSHKHEEFILFNPEANSRGSRMVIESSEESDFNNQGGTLSDKLNRRTLSVRELKVDIDRHSYKFEGEVTEKSSLSEARDLTKHFYVRVKDPHGSFINISFWCGAEKFYNQLQIGKTYYFIGGELKSFRNQIEIKNRYHDAEVIGKDSLNASAIPANQIEAQSKVIAVNFPNKRGKLFHPMYAPKSLMRISEVLTTEDQYIYTEGIVTDLIKNENWLKLMVRDDCSNPSSIQVVVFNELYEEWENKIQLGMKLIFENFVKCLFHSYYQLKNNKKSIIQISQSNGSLHALPLAAGSSTRAAFSSNELNNNQFNLNNNNGDKNMNRSNQLMDFKKHHSFTRQPYHFKKTMTLKEAQNKHKEPTNGDKIVFSVYADLISIQRGKVFYLRCPCSSKATKLQNNIFFCEACNNYTKPIVNLYFSAFLQDSTSTIPVMIFDPYASFLINKSNREIKADEAPQTVRSMIENEQEEEICALFANLDYKRFRFEVAVERKEFNSEQEISFKVQKIEENILDEALYLLYQIEQLMGSSDQANN